MHRFFMLALCAVAAAAVQGAEEAVPETDSEIWNRGVDYYRAGDVTNALATLKPLMLSRTHGPRAAEVVARLELDATKELSDAELLSHHENAAAAAQIALRANPDDERANANFTRAVDGLAAQREAKRVRAVLEAAKGKDPSSMLQSAMHDARRLATESAGVRTNVAAVAVRLADAYGSRAEKLADTWLPVKEFVCAAVTNQAELAEVSRRIDESAAKTREAARLLADMDDEARFPLAEAEQGFTEMFKAVVLPPASIREDLACQSNAWQDVAEECGRSWQREALDYTRAFRAKFPAWAREYEQRAASDTNMPPFTAEAQAEISKLSSELEKLQLGCCDALLPPQQESCVNIIRRIIELMPEEKGNGQCNNCQNSGGQSKNDKKNDDKDKKNDDKEQQNQDQKPDDKKDDGMDDEKEDDQKDGGQDDEQDEREIEAVLKKAQERNDEHEADKKLRARKARLPPNERDW